MCFGRNRDAALRTAFHSIIPKQLFFNDFDSGHRTTKGACHPLIVEELMENGQGLSATWGTNSDLPIEVVKAASSPSLGYISAKNYLI